MLRLTLYEGQVLAIGDTLITVVEVGRNRFKLGIDAPLSEGVQRYHEDGRPVLRGVPIQSILRVADHGQNSSGGRTIEVEAELQCTHRVTMTIAEWPRVGMALQCAQCTRERVEPDKRIAAFALKAKGDSKAEPVKAGALAGR